MLKLLWTCVSYLVIFVFVSAAVLGFTVAAQIVVHHASQYIVAFEDVSQAREYKKAEEYSTRLLQLTESVLSDKRALLKELDVLKAFNKSLSEQINSKEDSIANYVQTVQDLAMTARNLNFKVNELSKLASEMVDSLPEDKREEYRNLLLDIVSD